MIGVDGAGVAVAVVAAAAVGAMAADNITYADEMYDSMLDYDLFGQFYGK